MSEIAQQFRLDENSKVYKELEKIAKKNNIDVKQLLLSEQHLDSVCEVIYKSLPAVARVLVRRNKFKEIFNNNKQQIVDMLK